MKARICRHVTFRCTGAISTRVPSWLMPSITHRDVQAGNELWVGRLKVKKKVKVVDLYSDSTWSVSKALRYSTHCQGITQFYQHTLHFIRKWNEPYLPLPSQPQLVLIYRPKKDGRLSGPWWEVAPATSWLQIRHSVTQPISLKSGIFTTEPRRAIPCNWWGNMHKRVKQGAI